MRIKEIMTGIVETVESNATLRSAAQKMREADTGFLPVVEDGRAIGVVTDRDITVRGVAEGVDPDQGTVRDIMTGTIESISENASVEEAAETMKVHRIRRLVVSGEDDKLCGVLSLGDVATATGDREFYAQILEEVSQPA